MRGQQNEVEVAPEQAAEYKELTKDEQLKRQV